SGNTSAGRRHDRRSSRFRGWLALMVSGQWSVVSGQLSVVSCQWSVVSGQLSVVSCQLYGIHALSSEVLSPPTKPRNYRLANERREANN
ncbi:MAG: hypothetical protein ACLQVF_03130, partial [Isosphaeraceae bacterium]